jgi:hypothetical protein
MMGREPRKIFLRWKGHSVILIKLADRLSQQVHHPPPAPHSKRRSSAKPLDDIRPHRFPPGYVGIKSVIEALLQVP